MMTAKLKYEDLSRAVVDARAVEYQEREGGFVEVFYQGSPGKLFYGRSAGLLFEPVIEQKCVHKE